MIYNALLVVEKKEDALAVVDLFRCANSSVNFHVEAAFSASEAIKKLDEKNNGYDVILLDLDLSNGKGEFTFLRIYQAANLNVGQPNENRTPIVLMTSNSEEYSNLVLKGAMDVIYKPVSAKDLQQRLWVAILNFKYRRQKELHEDIRGIVQNAKEVLNRCP